MNRRTILQSAASAATAAAAAGTALAASAAATVPATAKTPSKLTHDTATITSHDGTRLYWRQWGAGKPVVFIHSWGMHSDMWQYQTTALAEHGIRCITYDRRGHGRSEQPADGYDFDTLADDTAAVLDALDLHDVTLVGHSMGGGEVVRYLTRHGTRRVARIVLLASITPFLTQTPDNPDGIPAAGFDQLRALWQRDFPKWIADNTKPFFTAETSPEMMRWGIDMMLTSSLPVLIQCGRSYASADFRADLRAVKVPALVIHGDADASAPIAITGKKTAALMPHCQFKVYAGAPHGLFLTHKDKLNIDLVEFISGTSA